MGLSRMGATILIGLLLSSCAPKSTVTVFGDSDIAASANALEGRIYFVPEFTDKLPDFTTLEPIGVVYTSTLDIAPRSFEEGFPGISDRFEWFALHYTGTLFISTAGEYTFELLSDDGSKLYIDDALVLDNDGIHPAVALTTSYPLEAGEHALRIDYFQGPRTEIALQLFITPPSGERQLLDTTVVY